MTDVEETKTSETDRTAVQNAHFLKNITNNDGDPELKTVGACEGHHESKNYVEALMVDTFLTLPQNVSLCYNKGEMNVTSLF